MKTIKKLFIITLSLVMALGSLSLFGCGQSDNDKDQVTTANISVRSANSTVKFRKTEIEKGDTDYQLTYNMVKNEYESYQLIISADDDVDSYYLTKSDLKNGNKILKAENVEIYVEQYVNLNSSADVSTYGAGQYPDALIPIDKAKEAGELIITKNENSALWITVYAPKDIDAGLYTGAFELNVGGKKFDVPVSVNISSYTLTDSINSATDFNWRFESIAWGEMDFSTEMLEKYYDFFVDYRVSLDHVATDNPANDPEEYADAIVKNWDKMSSFNYMQRWGIGPQGIMDNPKWNAVKGQILALVERSTTEVNYLEKGMFYFIDEPDFSNESVVNDCINQLKYVKNNLETLAKYIEKDTTGKYDNFKQIDNWQQSVKGIKTIIPINLEKIFGRLDEPKVQEFLDVATCLCPVWNNPSNSAYKETERILKEQYGIDFWWYGCVTPKAPYGNYHIGDTNLLSSRSMQWLQLMYNFSGNLYWDAAANTYYAGAEYLQPCDIYSMPYRTPGPYNTDVAGDGYLSYPGAKYGVYGPLPSMRLMSIRDGNEEYELLYAIKNELIAKCGEEAAQAEIERLCSNLYYNTTMLFADGDNNLDFNRKRAELIDVLESFEDGTGFIITSWKTNSEFAEVYFEVNTTAYSVFYGQKELTAISGNQFKLNIPLGSDGFYKFEFKNKTTGETITKYRFMGTGKTKLVDFDSITETPNGVVLASGDTCTINVEGNKTSNKNLAFTINSKITGNEIKDELFKPKLTLKKEFLGNVDFANVVYLHVDIYNLNTEDNKVSIYLRSSSGKEIVYVTSVLMSGLNSIDIPFKGIVNSDIANVTEVVFKFENKGTELNPYAHRVAIDNIYASMKENG